ncbi:hypothetical protein KB206_12040 [Microvirga sp. STS02]|uniref:hypothetical protein n=1 Tax=Hymenobacter negativus TaxID=2795026 RepID=UPI0018DB4E42|nr:MULTISPECIES: hypothetical protein [Bacteria]MBH8569619.1 hypothetical protein [Hymenobacter negativus]MBR7209355.1 hypothetical protein [Microvirga sp. STS02]
MTPRFPIFLLALSGLTGCTLTADDVEPALPSVPVLQTNTVAYQLNGLPVVAHNYSSLISAIFSFGSRSLPVDGFLYPDSTVVIGAVDDQNYIGAGALQHGLEWQLLHFRGVGRYAVVPGHTVFQVDTRDAANKEWINGPSQPLAAQPAAQVVVTAWDPATQHISGTFTMRFAAAGSAPAADLQDGRFDLKLGR